ncbi:predicted protein [Naegleria gruberi]|uniref:Predicted protein n=1 Tax=Naegleria gruberi TaxID=5762 RepID=D2VS82_NAEGR|nr:uncharacterized protein NAEGRDRAFT_81043 [Naegleria gruberi]EFC40296.1 predicted protein [Naegleria gruberi]|eukprot:XP_002673040.1 predicted protein [Naegleria gruberi strain NEG-M]
MLTRNRTDSNSSDLSTGSYDSGSAGSGKENLFKQMYAQRDSISLKSGKLVKQGKTVKNWKERFFMLRRDGLYYHELTTKGQAGKLKGKISFKEIKGNPTCIQKVTVTVKNKQRSAISIELPERVYFVYSESEIEFNDWYKSIIQVLSMKDEEPASRLTPRTGTPNTPTSGTITQDIFNTKPAASPSGGSGTFGTPPLRSFDLKKASPSSASPLDYGSSPMDFKRTNSNLSDVTTSDDSDTSSYQKSLHGDLLSEFDEFGAARNSDAESVDFEQQPQQNVGPILTEDDEYNIAMSAVEIFLKKEEERTPHEQAYIIALNDYRRRLDEHARRANARPEYSLAVGTCIFLTPEKDRTISEQEYVKDVLSAFFEDQKESDKSRLLPLKIQMDIVKAAKLLKEKPENQRTEEEKQYISRVEEIQRQLNRFSLKNGLKINHSLSTLPLQLLTTEKTKEPPQHPLYHNCAIREADPQAADDEKPNLLSVEENDFLQVFIDQNNLNF